MFEKLIESSKQRERGRTGRYFLVTGLVYGAVLTAFGVMTIFWFNPNIVEAYVDLARLIPPGPPLPSQPSAPLPRRSVTGQSATANQLALSENTPVAIAEMIKTLPPRLPQSGPFHPNLIIGDNSGIGSNGFPGVPGAHGMGDPPPPPPRAIPTPTPTPPPAPTPVKPVRMTSHLLQGNAINKVQPPYPEIARRAGIQSPVQVQIMISEDGRVLTAEVLSGHIMLREAARQAALQWRFRPTILNGVAVPVTGIITFDFKLNR